MKEYLKRVKNRLESLPPNVLVAAIGVLFLLMLAMLYLIIKNVK